MENVDNSREMRKTGSVLVLGRTEYLIEGVEGTGGSTIVYRASYEDELNRPQRHGVLIKELYPWTADGSIYRDEAGNICCSSQAQDFFELSRKSFYKGNSANLSLLGKNPERISGNLNSYEAYGTYYSVLSLHGGENLADYLKKEGENLTLERAAQLTMMILDSLESLHRDGIVHLDISPDNILVLPTYALLIDYNSVWSRESDPSEFTFSEKDGYVSPEVRLRDISNIGPASDLYSVCAVFFRMLTGRRMNAKESGGSGLKAALREDLPVFRNVPRTAQLKAVQILTKGLHLLSRKRYQSTDCLRADLEELLLRIEKKGITVSSLREGSLTEWSRLKKDEAGYIPRALSAGQGDRISEEQTLRAVSGGKLMLLTGAGGMGKTRFLQRIWRTAAGPVRERDPVVFYIPLAGYQEAGSEAYYIHKYLLRHIVLTEDESETDACMAGLERLFEEGKTSWVFLLDGLNESGGKNSLLIKEIEELGKKRCVGIIVSDRSDYVKEYAFAGFETALLLPLSDEAVRGALGEMNVSYPEKKSDAQALSNPLILSLYLKTAALVKDEAQRPGIETAQKEGQPAKEEKDRAEDTLDSIILSYVDALCLSQMRKDSGDNRSLLRHKYIIGHLLPELALELKQKKRTFFTYEELSLCLKRDYKELRSRDFAHAFPEFSGKSRLILEGIEDEREWMDLAVSEELVHSLSLLEEREDHCCGFIHDTFIDALARRGRENRLQRSKGKRGKYILCAAAAAVLAAAIIAAVIFFHGRTLSAEDEADIYSASQQLIINTGIINSQLSAAEDILDTLGSESVLLEEEGAVSDALEEIEALQDQLEVRYKAYSDGSSYIQALSDVNAKLAVDILSDVYIQAGEMQLIFEKNTEILIERFCDEGSVYDTPEKKEPVLEAYEEYLEAFAQVYYLEYNLVLLSFEEAGAQESADELTENIKNMNMFYEYVSAAAPGSWDEETLNEALEAALLALNEACNAMAAQNMYYISF